MNPVSLHPAQRPPSFSSGTSRPALSRLPKSTLNDVPICAHIRSRPRTTPPRPPLPTSQAGQQRSPIYNTSLVVHVAAVAMDDRSLDRVYCRLTEPVRYHRSAVLLSLNVCLHQVLHVPRKFVEYIDPMSNVLASCRL
jgi:hypothetical protein